MRRGWDGPARASIGKIGRALEALSAITLRSRQQFPAPRARPESLAAPLVRGRASRPLCERRARAARTERPVLVLQGGPAHSSSCERPQDFTRDGRDGSCRHTASTEVDAQRSFFPRLDSRNESTRSPARLRPARSPRLLWVALFVGQPQGQLRQRPGHRHASGVVGRVATLASDRRVVQTFLDVHLQGASLAR